MEQEGGVPKTRTRTRVTPKPVSPPPAPSVIAKRNSRKTQATRKQHAIAVNVEALEKPHCINKTVSSIFPTISNLKALFGSHRSTEIKRGPPHNIKLYFGQDESVELFARFIIDVLHDNHGARGKNTIEAYYKNNFPVFITEMVRGMYILNGRNDAAIPQEAATAFVAAVIAKVGSLLNIEMHKPIPQQSKYVDTTALKQTRRKQRIQSEYPFPSIDERRYFESTIKNIQTKSHPLHTQNLDSTPITTQTIVSQSSVTPTEIMYDQGGQLLCGDLALYGSTHISLVNFMDKGDSYRDRNQIITAIKAILDRRGAAVGIRPSTRNIASMLFSNVLPKAVLDAADSLYNNKITGLSASNVRSETTLFIAMLEDFISYYTTISDKSAAATSFIYNMETEFDNFKEIVFDELTSSGLAYIIHHRDINIQVQIQIGADLLDFINIKYNIFSDAVDIFMFNLPEVRCDTFSAKDVADRFVSETPIAPQTAFINCMMKYVGDFCQIIYAFYMGIVFGSGDISTIANAIFIMNYLNNNAMAYNTFKGTLEDARVLSERRRRGMIIADQVSFRGKNLQKVAYYLDDRAFETYITNPPRTASSPQLHPLKRWANMIGAIYISPDESSSAAAAAQTLYRLHHERKVTRPVSAPKTGAEIEAASAMIELQETAKRAFNSSRRNKSRVTRLR